VARGIWPLFQDVELGAGFSLFPERWTRLGRRAKPASRIAGSTLDTDPATAFIRSEFQCHNTKAARQRVYVTLHNSGEYELPIGYATVNGDLFKLPAGPISLLLAVNMTRRGGRVMIATRLNTTFKALARRMEEARE